MEGPQMATDQNEKTIRPLDLIMVRFVEDTQETKSLYEDLAA